MAEVTVEGRRYVVCHNPSEAEKDKADREAILAELEEKLKSGPKALIGNRGYRRYLKVDGGAVVIDREKLKEEEKFDGKFVLVTNTALPAAEVAKQYKKLWMVEAFFRASKSLLETRPVFHQNGEAIRGHIFCSFLALLLRHELMERLKKRDEKPEWSDIIRDLAALQEVEVEQEGERYRLRLPLQGICGKHRWLRSPHTLGKILRSKRCHHSVCNQSKNHDCQREQSSQGFLICTHPKSQLKSLL